MTGLLSFSHILTHFFSVRLLANATKDAEAVADALQDAEDHWAPPQGFNS